MLNSASTALQRVLLGKTAQSQMLLGLRGVGKTVLLNKIEEIAEEAGFLTSFIEAPEDRSLVELLYPKIHQVLRKLSLIENAKAATLSAMRALRGFASVFKISVDDFDLSVDPEAGLADSGNLEIDVTDLFLEVGRAAQAAGKGWAIFIDGVQYLKSEELAALIVAIHRVNQKSLPVLLFGAGLPQIAAIAGDAKSYAERLFIYPKIDALPADAAKRAIREPINDEEEEIDSDLLETVVEQSKDAPDQQALPEAVGVIAVVCQHRLGRGDRDGHQWLGCGVIGCLAAGQDEAERQSLIVCFARLRLRIGRESCS